LRDGDKTTGLDIACSEWVPSTYRFEALCAEFSSDIDFETANDKKVVRSPLKLPPTEPLVAPGLLRQEDIGHVVPLPPAAVDVITDRFPSSTHIPVNPYSCITPPLDAHDESADGFVYQVCYVATNMRIF
jgi:hypothetical protein